MGANRREGRQAVGPQWQVQGPRAPLPRLVQFERRCRQRDAGDALMRFDRLYPGTFVMRRARGPSRQHGERAFDPSCPVQLGAAAYHAGGIQPARELCRHRAGTALAGDQRLVEQFAEAFDVIVV